MSYPYLQEYAFDWLIQALSHCTIGTTCKGVHMLQITVAELKQQLRDKTNIPVERQRIIYQGRALENGQQLQSYGGFQITAAHSVTCLCICCLVPITPTSHCLQVSSRGTACIWLNELHLLRHQLLYLLKHLAKLQVSRLQLLSTPKVAM